MHTEKAAYDALIRLANAEGRRGKKIYGWAIIPPATATQNYSIVLQSDYPNSATESWD